MSNGIRRFILDACDEALSMRPNEWLCSSDVFEDVRRISHQKDLTNIRVSLHLRELSGRDVGVISSRDIKNNRRLYKKILDSDSIR